MVQAVQLPRQQKVDKYFGSIILPSHWPMAEERAFPAMNVVTTDRCNCLGEDHLDDLMCIAIDGPPLPQWNASGVIDLCWKDKLCCQVLDKRSTPRLSHSSSVV